MFELTATIECGYVKHKHEALVRGASGGNDRRSTHEIGTANQVTRRADIPAGAGETIAVFWGTVTK